MHVYIYICIMSTVSLFMLHLWYKQRHMSNFSEFFQQYFKTLLGTETSHIDYVKSIWLVQQEHRTINQEQPYIYTACLKYTSVAVTQILQLWYMELGAFNLSHREVAAECLSLPTVSPQTVCPLRYSIRQCQSNITLRKRFQNDFPTFVILYL